MARRNVHAPARMHEVRRRIAVEAARLISEEGVRDYRQAKLKAAGRIGVVDDAGLPRNVEIEDALREHQRLFRGDRHADTLRDLRKVALEAMRFFAPYEPRLVGAVLEGSADEHSAVCLHLYSDQPDAIAAFLAEHRIPHDGQTRTLRLDRDSARDFPVFLFSADDTQIDVTVLPYDRLRQAPLDRISEKPMRRASLAAIESLLSANTEP
jgi:hypothetical protein